MKVGRAKGCLLAALCLVLLVGCEGQPGNGQAWPGNGDGGFATGLSSEEEPPAGQSLADRAESGDAGPCPGASQESDDSMSAKGSGHSAVSQGQSTAQEGGSSAAGQPPEEGAGIARPPEGERRYTGDYNTAFSDYSDIRVTDGEGEDIAPMAIDLWYAANEIYNEGSREMFDFGIPGYSDRLFPEYEHPESYLLEDYDAVVKRVFTPHGIAQLEGTWVDSAPLIRKAEGKVYRVYSWKSGYPVAGALLDMRVTQRGEDTLTLAVTYALADNDNRVWGEETVPFAIARQDGRWLVEDYLYPGADQYRSESGREGLPYEAYFGQEIVFEPRLRSAEAGVLYLYREGAADPYAPSPAGAVEGQLYKKTMRAEGEGYTPVFTLLLEGPVEAYAPLEDAVFAAVGPQLYRVELMGGKPQLLLTAEGPITQLAATENLVYFVAEGYLYRHYLPAGRTDRLCPAAGIVGALTPLSNHRVRWRATAAPGEGESVFYYDDREGTVRQLEEGKAGALR